VEVSPPRMRCSGVLPRIVVMMYVFHRPVGTRTIYVCIYDCVLFFIVFLVFVISSVSCEAVVNLTV
jgi:hypothetical protein